MSIELFLVLASALCECGQSGARLQREQDKTRNSSLAKRNQFPYAVHLKVVDDDDDGWWICTASVIGPRTILTAAHCVMNLDHGKTALAKNIEASVGNIDIRKSRKIKIIKNIPHPRCNDSGVSFNDIAVLKTATDMTDKNVATTCIASSKTRLDQYLKNATALGWGYRNTERLTVHTNLRFINLNVLKYANCKKIAPTSTRRHICALGMKDNICFGDAGGHLTSVRKGGKDVIIGLASSGSNAKCTGDKKRPPIYTRVAAYEKWIIKAAGKDGKNICRH